MSSLSPSAIIHPISKKGQAIPMFSFNNDRGNRAIAQGSGTMLGVRMSVLGDVDKCSKRSKLDVYFELT